MRLLFAAPFRLRACAVVVFMLCLLAPRLAAQAAFAGTYIGTMNTKVSAGGIGLESSFGAYLATVSSTGAIDLNIGALTGTVAADGKVTFTGGS
ncbi:MAG TPA: hypothetical protein VHF69_14055, partial [Candidatus Synoicihabitans sp.]|nr:hypothetical protein [Candidatus Synoicihabitans sp.]